MTRELFESFYHYNIDIIAKELVADKKGFSYSENMNGVYEEYLNQKIALKYLIKSDVDLKSKGSNEALLDGHKVAACMTCAIIKVRLIVNDEIDDSEGNLCYSLETSNRLNEQVALFSGLSCLMEYMAAKKDNLFVDPTCTDTIDLILPDTFYNNRSTYLDSLIRGLYFSNLLSVINPLLLSHIYFLIDSYHRRSIELKKAEAKIDELSDNFDIK